MRRYLPLFLISFFIVIVLLAGTVLLPGFAGKKVAENKKELTVYTTIPAEEISVLAQEYEKVTKVHINVIPLTTANLVERLKAENVNSPADVILGDRLLLNQVKKAGYLAAYTSESVDMIPDKFKDMDDFWTGVWYDPMVFAINQEFMKVSSEVPTMWSDLPKNNQVRIAFTDFLAADASANLFYSLAIANGEDRNIEYLRKIHPQVIQYAKFLATPVRMAGMGECDVAIAAQSEALRYVHDSFPIKIIYPLEGTSFMLTGVGKLAFAPHHEEAEDFIEWLIQDQAQTVLKENKFYFIPTNPLTQDYQEYAAKNIVLFDRQEEFAPEQKRVMLDKWVQTVRFSAK